MVEQRPDPSGDANEAWQRIGAATALLSTAMATLAFALVVTPASSASPQALDIIAHGSADRKAVALVPAQISRILLE